MTVNNQSNVTTYEGTGSTTTFATEFQFYDADTIFVTVDGVSETNFTVTGGNGEDGSVIFDSGHIPASGTAIVIERIVPYTQETVFANLGITSAATTQQTIDTIVMMAQQLLDATTRSITIPVGSSGISTDLPAPSADKALVWNSTGTALENSTFDPDSAATAAAASASAAASSASSASTSASNASTSASNAATSATASASSAAAAAASAASLDLPTLTGNANKILKANSLATEYEFGVTIPNSIVGDANKLVQVNSDGTGYSYGITFPTSISGINNGAQLAKTSSTGVSFINSTAEDSVLVSNSSLLSGNARFVALSQIGSSIGLLEDLLSYSTFSGVSTITVDETLITNSGYKSYKFIVRTENTSGTVNNAFLEVKLLVSGVPTWITSGGRYVSNLLRTFGGTNFATGSTAADNIPLTNLEPSSNYTSFYAVNSSSIIRQKAIYIESINGFSSGSGVAVMMGGGTIQSSQTQQLVGMRYSVSGGGTIQGDYYLVGVR